MGRDLAERDSLLYYFIITVPFAYRLQGHGPLQSHIISTFDNLFHEAIDQRGFSEKLKALLARFCCKMILQKNSVQLIQN
jgi:hypothetical protein